MCIKEEKLKDPSMTRLMKMNAKEWFYIFIGCINALAQGVVQPAFAILFGIMLGVCCQFALRPCLQMVT